MSSLIGTSADWYLMRGSGFVALALLTVTVCFGVANVARAGKAGSARTLVTLVHRNASLLSVVFLLLHVGTAISDRYVNIPALSIVIPGQSGYDPLWIGVGAVSLDLLAAVIVTSLLRARLRYRSWQLVHWLSYLSWPTAVVHSIGSGSGTGVDTGRLWSTVVYAVCGVAFAAAVAVRLLRRQPPTTPLGPGRRPPAYAPPPARRPAAPAPSHAPARSPAPVPRAAPATVHSAAGLRPAPLAPAPHAAAPHAAAPLGPTTVSPTPTPRTPRRSP